MTDGFEGIDLALIVESIARCQLGSGMIPWAKGSHADAWNHTEAVMALSIGSRLDEARRGVDWVAGSIGRDGTICQFYSGSGVREPRIDLNCCLYTNVGLLAFLVASRDVGYVAEVLPRFDLTTNFVLGYQRSDGSFPWAIDPDLTPKSSSLKAASSAMLISLEAAMVLDELVGRNRPELKEAHEALAGFLGDPGSEFLDKSEWAMDGYYPVLAGVFDQPGYASALRSFMARFYIEGEGIQAVASSNWITVAETSEVAMAEIRLGNLEAASRLLRDLGPLARPDGGFLTGWVLPERRSFPAGEVSSYSAAAYVIARFLLSQERPVGLIEGLLALENS